MNRRGLAAVVALAVLCGAVATGAYTSNADNTLTFLRELFITKREQEVRAIRSIHDSIAVMNKTEDADQFIRELNNLFLREIDLQYKSDYLFSDITKIQVSVTQPMNARLLHSKSYYDLMKLDPKIRALLKETGFFDFVEKQLGQVIFIPDPENYKGVFPDKKMPYATTEYLSKSVIVSMPIDKTNALELVGAIVHECYHLSTWHKYKTPILGEKDATLFELQYWDRLLSNKTDLSKDEIAIIQRNVSFIKQYTGTN